MENIITKTNEQFGTIRQISGKPALWCGTDVAKALGYSNPRKAIIDHCKGVTKRDAPTNSGVQKMSFIPEADVYRLICHSKLPKAQEFEKWVFEDVVPKAVHGEPHQLTFDDYSYFDKTFRGQSVLSTADIANMTRSDRSTISYAVRKYLTAGKDYYFLEKGTLAEFKVENPKVYRHIGAMHIITQSGFDKLCRIYGIKIEKPELFIEKKLESRAYLPSREMKSLIGYLDSDMILINEYCRRILNASDIEEAEQSRNGLVKAIRSLRQFTVDVECIAIK
ncbi:Bro-N domain-containing protein [uncultured Ruminococcus sp.]|uniref:BRO-N domain-containing protein n=1 Tax=uncultured Ruminococcus sp. TaxID=165186 RepID=UPI0025D038E5|nr:Bro-N domain-containing protein [uncultured Ruminococcus sp.]